MAIHVHRRAEQATQIGQVLVATDSAEIQKVVQEHGKQVVLTGKGKTIKVVLGDVGF